MTKKSLLTNDLIVFLTNTNSFLFSLKVVHQLLPKIKRMHNTITITNHFFDLCQMIKPQYVFHICDSCEKQ